MTEESISGHKILEIPIFQLPNVVLFPNTFLPLHIFEPHYRKMVRKVLDPGQEVGMTLLKQPWNRQNGSQVFQVGGMGKIAEYRELENGKFDVLLKGTSRFKLIKFLRHSPYPIGRVRILPEPPPHLEQAYRLTSSLVSSFGKLSEMATMNTKTEMLEDLDFQTLVNSICSSINISDYQKQLLLEMNDLAHRANNLLKIIDDLLVQQGLVERFHHLRPKNPCYN